MRSGLGAVLGSALLTLGLGLHHSETATVLGRWSLIYAGSLGAAILLTVLLAIRTYRFRGDSAQSRRSQQSGFWVDLAVLAYGASYLIAAAQDRTTASRLLDLNLTGSEFPVPIVLEWFALAFLLIAVVALIPTLPSPWMNPAVMLGTLGIALLAIEGWARGAAIVNPEVQGFPTHRTRMWMRRYHHLNSAGFRDREHPRDPVPGTRRLLVIGDSFAAGFGLSNPDDRVGSQLAASLSGISGSRWESVHCAKPDSHTLQHIEFLKQCLTYRPNLVILLYVFNDMNYLREGRDGRGSLLAGHPGGIVNRLHPIRLLFVNFFAVQEVYVRTRQWQSVKDVSAEVEVYHDSAKLEQHLDDLMEFVRTGREATSRVVIVPFSIWVATSEFERERYRRFAVAATRRSLPVWSVDSVFIGRPFPDLVVGPLDTHPNEFANSLLAQAILPRIQRLAAEGLP